MKVEITGQFTVISGLMIRGTYQAGETVNPTTGHFRAVMIEFRGAECDRGYALQHKDNALLDPYELIDYCAPGWRKARLSHA